jgi:hypothetical protein
MHLLHRDALKVPPLAPFFLLCQHLRDELALHARKQCQKPMAAFAACAKENGMFVIFKCRALNNASRCLEGGMEARQILVIGLGSCTHTILVVHVGKCLAKLCRYRLCFVYCNLYSLSKVVAETLVRSAL